MLQFIRKLTRASTHSYSLNIPKEIIQKYGWKEKQKIVIEDQGRGRLLIRDWRNK
ncbi:MAG: AbrB/MazE/SpoVT family DNA-binding domain-containing protein [Patescibacteria group bacterium]|jgi:bifunctional DNA-binding transcriptional regulator/antitoxin component of YhaV-PrlF toxin-antitoxin module|nr:AbrB/MazE/SpoVT family DNA-binding domain-containing protein [Patescibacteria group bacterium]